jgi:hypothetical protein
MMGASGFVSNSSPHRYARPCAPCTAAALEPGREAEDRGGSRHNLAARLLRMFENWPVIIGDCSVPKWVSWAALIVAGGLALFGFRFTADETE